MGNYRRQPRQRRSSQRHLLDDYWFRGLTTGRIFFHTDEQDAPAVWEQHRDHVLETFIDEHPGRRPWAWWQFDAPEPRRMLATPRWTPTAEEQKCLDGYRRAKANPEKWAPSWTEINNFGLPYLFWGGDSPFFESEADYLLRHNLLTIDERIALANQEDAKQ